MGFPHFKSMEANNSQGMANLDPRGMFGRIYELNIKLWASWFHSSVIVYILPIIILWTSVANVYPMGMIGRIFVENH